MKCPSCNGCGWLHPSYQPCLRCHGRGRLLPTLIGEGETLRSVVLDGAALVLAVAVACAAGMALLFL